MRRADDVALDHIAIRIGPEAIGVHRVAGLGHKGVGTVFVVLTNSELLPQGLHRLVDVLQTSVLRPRPVVDPTFVQVRLSVKAVAVDVLGDGFSNVGVLKVRLKVVQMQRDRPPRNHAVFAIGVTARVGGGVGVLAKDRLNGVNSKVVSFVDLVRDHRLGELRVVVNVVKHVALYFLERHEASCAAPVVITVLHAVQDSSEVVGVGQTPRARRNRTSTVVVGIVLGPILVIPNVLRNDVGARVALVDHDFGVESRGREVEVDLHGQIVNDLSFLDESLEDSAATDFAAQFG